MKNQPMAFTHSKGFAPTWHMAQRYAGRDGRFATLPHILAARMATRPPETPWDYWFTTLSAEYVGLSRGGTKLLIVAHGVGPMATKNGISAAHSHAGRCSAKQGGQISVREFRKLEAGRYGPVAVVDLDQYLRNSRAFSNALRLSEAEADMVLYARMGDCTVRYLAYQASLAREWHDEQARTAPRQRPYDNTWVDLGEAARSSRFEARRAMHLHAMRDPYLVGLQMPEYSYRRDLKDGEVLAHLLTISRLGEVHAGDDERLIFSIYPQDWSGGFRFVAVPKGAQMNTIHPGWNYKEQVARHWHKLMVALADPPTIGLREIMKLGDNWFTQRLEGFVVTAREPQFRVTEVQQLGSRAALLGARGSKHSFAYDLREVRNFAPSGAGGFAFSNIQPLIDGDGTVTHHRAQITFFKVVVDTSHELRREADVEGDYDTQMVLLGS